MNFVEMRDAVLADTRADQHEGLINRKINAAIRYISRMGLFQSDFQEIFMGVTDGVDSESYVQSLAIPLRFRRFVYVQNAECKGLQFKSFELKDTAAGINAPNSYYVGGNLLHIRHAILTAQFALGYYEYPLTLINDTDVNWVSEELADVVIDYAVSMVLIQLGEKETSGKITQFSQQNLAISLGDMIKTGVRSV